MDRCRALIFWTLSFINLFPGYATNAYVANALRNESFSCPKVFAIPTDPASNKIEWVYSMNGINICAQKCKSPVWSNLEWETMFSIAHSVMWIGLPLDLIIIITWILSEKRKKQYFVLSFAMCSCIMQSSLVYSSFFPFEEAYCKSNAVRIGPGDGFHSCNVQSFMALYGFAGCCMSWMLQSFDLFRKVALKKHDTNILKSTYLSIIFGTPLILSFIMGVTETYGYLPGTTVCFVGETYITYLAYFPFIISITFGCPPAFYVIITVIRVFNGSKKEITIETMAQIHGAILFVTSFMILIIPILIYRFYGYMYVHHGSKFPMANMSPWIDCIFDHYDGTDESWMSICGETPPIRIPYILSVFHAITTHGTALLISSTYLFQPSVWRIWNRWLRKSRLCRKKRRQRVFYSSFWKDQKGHGNPVIRPIHVIPQKSNIVNNNNNNIGCNTGTGLNTGTGFENIGTENTTNILHREQSNSQNDFFAISNRVYPLPEYKAEDEFGQYDNSALYFDASGANLNSTMNNPGNGQENSRINSNIAWNQYNPRRVVLLSAVEEERGSSMLKTTTIA